MPVNVHRELESFVKDVLNKKGPIEFVEIVATSRFRSRVASGQIVQSSYYYYRILKSNEIR